MTREEAIKIIGNLEDKDILFNPCDVQDAKAMAINALTALEKIYAELERTMKDYKTDLVHFIPLLCVKETLDKYTKGESK